MQQPTKQQQEALLADHKKQEDAFGIKNEGPATIFIDKAMAGLRADNLMLIRLFTQMPLYTKEEIRFVGTTAFIKRLIDSLCQALDYYPTKGAKSEADK